MKKRILIPIAILIMVYFIAIVEQNNIVGDLLSPILTFLAFAPVFYAFFWKEQHKLLKICCGRLFKASEFLIAPGFLAKVFK